MKILPWVIETEDCGKESREFRESIFSLGNGYMGTRGYRPEQPGVHSAWRSTFISGFFEYIRPGITDMVNQPDFSATEIRISGRPVTELGISECVQRLHMDSGLVEWEYTAEADGAAVRVRVEKFLSMANRHTAAMRFTLTPKSSAVDCSVAVGLDGAVRNLPIADNQLQDNTEFARIWGELDTKPLEGGGMLTAKTSESGRVTAMCFSARCTGVAAGSRELREDYVGSRFEARLEPGRSLTVEKLISVACFRDGAEPERIAYEALKSVESKGFDGMLEDTKRAWSEIWSDLDIKLTGCDEWQGALRYNIFQLIQSTPEGDGRASIGARGLTHGRYKGCYFWDTEIFMLPMFTCMRPGAARSLLEYRYSTLDDAVKSAEGFSTKGARYSWMSADTGFEQCETWDTGCCEIHITADIAYAIGSYCRQTGDMGFLLDCGCEILVQTARYWTDRFNYCPGEDRYHLLFVKGPDEYCGVTTDDFYSVRMAAHNLRLAAEAVDTVRRGFRKKWESLREKLAIDDSEPKKWLEIAEKTSQRYDAEKKLWIQDSTFEYLEPLDIEAHKTGNLPLYRTISFDRLQRYKVLKQPAVLMYMALMPEEFSMEELRAAWDYYEPKTLHDSTLSYGIHAMLAARLGLEDKAVSYFEKSLFLDLKDVMSNTGHEGIHTASLGATWQAMVFGFCGLKQQGGRPVCEPRLPAGIESVGFSVQCEGKRFAVHITGQEANIAEVCKF